MQTMTLRTPNDVLAAIPEILGFMPHDSLVIVGCGSAPTARVDMPTCPAEIEPLRQGLSGALRHWSHSPVIVVGYTGEVSFFDLPWGELLPGVDVLVIGRVFEGALITPDGEVLPYVATMPEGITPRDDVQFDRDALVEEASLITASDLAMSAAWEFYQRGDGARAWCYLDRAVELGHPGDADLVYRLESAIRPDGV